MNTGEGLDWGICGVGVLPSDRRMAEVEQYVTSDNSRLAREIEELR